MPLFLPFYNHLVFKILTQWIQVPFIQLLHYILFINLEFCSQSTFAPCSQTSVTDLSQDFSPSKLGHKDSLCLNTSTCDSSQKTIGDCDENEQVSPPKKQIFKIIREVKPVKR